MKDVAVYGLFIVSFGCGVLLFAKKAHQDSGEFTKLEGAIAGVKQVLPENANLSYIPVAVKPEFFSWARYCVAPLYLSENKLKCDTSLAICPISLSDSLLRGFAQRKIIWQHKDELYFYLISAKS